jgi:hypothetical protein
MNVGDDEGGMLLEQKISMEEEFLQSGGKLKHKA